MPFITQGKINLKYILIVVILTVIVGGGILGYYYSWIKELETKLAEMELRLPEVKPSEDETANWKTYTNKNLKILFKYPNNFYQGDDFGEIYYYQLRFSTCEFKKENGAEVEQGPECPSFSLGMSLGKTTDQYDLVNKTEIGGSSVDESFGSSGILTYRRFTDLNTSVGKWLRYETEAGGKLVPKYSYGNVLRKGNNEYAFRVSSESKNIVDSNIKVLEQIVSSFKFLD